MSDPSLKGLIQRLTKRMGSTFVSCPYKSEKPTGTLDILSASKSVKIRLKSAQQAVQYLYQASALCRQHFASEVAAQAEQSLIFADFRRDPEVDPDTGEPLEVQPKFYESFPEGVVEVR